MCDKAGLLPGKYPLPCEEIVVGHNTKILAKLVPESPPAQNMLISNPRTIEMKSQALRTLGGKIYTGAPLIFLDNLQLGL